MDKNKKLKMGIMGCADIAKRLVIPNLIASKKFEIAAIASRSLSKAQEMTNKFGGKPVEGYQQLLDLQEIDCVYIPLPTGLHHEWIIKSLKAGKHVFSEKSIALNSSEVREIIDLAKTNKLCVFENFMFPYHTQIEFVKEKIEQGMIGELRLLRSLFGFPVFNKKDNIRYKKDLGGGALLDCGAYALMAAQTFLGKKQKVLSSSLNSAENEVDFHGSITLLNENNIISQLSFGFDNYYQNNIELWGSSGKIIIHRAFTAGPNHIPEISIEKQGVKSTFSLPSDNHFLKIIDEFYFSILNNYSSKYDEILNQSILLTNAYNLAHK